MSRSTKERYPAEMEWSQIYSRPDIPGLELLHARFDRHRYARHAHEYAVIGLVDCGVQSYFYRGARHRTGPNGMFFVNPDEAHTGESGSADGYEYRALYPSSEFLIYLLADERIRHLHFRQAVIHDSILAKQLRDAHISVERGESRLTCELLLLNTIAGLLNRNGILKPSVGKGRPIRDAVRRVRATIDADPAGNLSLAFLANIAHMSPHHLAHVFVRETGLPVHVYAETARIRLAKSLLKDLTSIAEVATRLGYSDQAHFTRRFKQFQGVTPGKYQRNATLFKTLEPPE